MPREIERKFLVASNAWRESIQSSTFVSQAYLGGTNCLMRVRIRGESGFLTIKSLELGVSRDEFDYIIPAQDAALLIERFADGPVICKTRHLCPVGAHVYEVDEFAGANAGLIVAELELADIEQAFERPAWLGLEVTDDVRFFNNQLAARPFQTWPDAARFRS